MSEYFEDKNGNRCYVSHFGSEKLAKLALDHLVGCTNCINCQICRFCHDCNDCMNCCYCTDCTGCVGCAGRAVDSLKDCRYCVNCFGGEDCVECINCYYCKGCKSCINCGRCVACIKCEDCFSEPWNLKSVPVVEDIHRRIYEAATIRGSLNMEAIHTCDTVHCRAGWAIELAGDSGYALEAATSGIFAAMMIYKVSGYPISPVRFFETEVQALQDMRTLALGGS